jgi:hypothetical protein
LDVNKTWNRTIFQRIQQPTQHFGTGPVMA